MTTGEWISAAAATISALSALLAWRSARKSRQATAGLAAQGDTLRRLDLAFEQYRSAFGRWSTYTMGLWDFAGHLSARTMLTGSRQAFLDLRTVLVEPELSRLSSAKVLLEAVEQAWVVIEHLFMQIARTEFRGEFGPAFDQLVGAADSEWIAERREALPPLLEAVYRGNSELRREMAHVREVAFASLTAPGRKKG